MPEIVKPTPCLSLSIVSGSRVVLRPSVRISHVVTANGKKETQYEAIFLQVYEPKRQPLPHSSSRGIALARLHSRCIPNTTMRLCRRPATGGPPFIEMARGSGMATSPDP